MRLFTERGFEATTVDDITSAAGVSRRTFFRYFEAKADVVWGEFDSEVEAIGRVLDTSPATASVPDAVRAAVLAVNHYRAEDVPDLRQRMSLIASVPDLSAAAARHYDAWEAQIARFAARRAGTAVNDLYPQTVARTTLAACRAAYEQWTARTGDAAAGREATGAERTDLRVYLDAALQILFDGAATPPAVDPAAVGRSGGPISDGQNGRPAG